MNTPFSRLPIYGVITDIKQALSEQQDILLIAQPGAGKTSCVPLWVKDALPAKAGKVIVLEPRRLATRAAAERLAEGLSEQVGERVGYRMRFDTKVGPNTEIEVMTLGVFLNLLQSDPSLEGVGAVIFDEFHERSLDNDLGFSLVCQARDLFREEDPLSLILMSATLNSQEVLPLLSQATLIQSEGKSYPVDVQYRPQPQRLSAVEHCAKVVLEALNTPKTMDSVLVFLPGQREIFQCRDALMDLALDSDVDIHCLFGQMDFSAQREAIAPSPEGRRKVVLATAIAESSLTIDGIGAVVDMGLSRESRFDAASALSQLVTVGASKAQATQRAGRAGRLAPGICYRLWSSDQHGQRPNFPQPELLSADLAPLLLQLYRWGVDDIDDLTWVSRPSDGRVSAAQQLLVELGALNDEASLALTLLGETMAQLPVHPRLAAMLVASASPFNQAFNRPSDQPNDQTSGAILSLVAELAESDTKATAADNPDPSSAYLAVLAGYLAAFISEVKPQSSDVTDCLNQISRLPHFAQQQLFKQASQLLSGVVQRKEVEHLWPSRKGLQALSQWLECLTMAQKRLLFSWLLSRSYPDRIAVRRDTTNPSQRQNLLRYQLSGGKEIGVSPTSALARYPVLVVASMYKSEHSSAAKVGLASTLEREYVERLWSERCVNHAHAYWDEKAKRIRCESQKRLGEVCLEAKPSTEVSKEQRLAAWRGYLNKRGLRCLNWSKSAQMLLNRVRFLHECSQLPEGAAKNAYLKAMAEHKNEQWPDFSDEALLAQVPLWLGNGLENCARLDELKKIDLTAALKTLIPWQFVRLLDQIAPTQLTVPSGRQVALDYGERPPSLALKLQDMFGCTETPFVAGQPIKLTLLSPAMRPIQVTQDLAGFWSSSYAHVQKDMKSQYPKHYWPDDPSQVSATKTSLKKHRQ